MPFGEEVRSSSLVVATGFIQPFSVFMIRYLIQADAFRPLLSVQKNAIHGGSMQTTRAYKQFKSLCRAVDD